MRKREIWGMGQDMVLNLVCEYSESGTWFVSFFVQHDVATQKSLAAWPSLTVQTEYIVFPCFPDALDDFSSDKSEKFLCFLVLFRATGGFIVWGWGGIGLPLFERHCANQNDLPFASICYILSAAYLFAPSHSLTGCWRSSIFATRDQRNAGSCSEQLKTQDNETSHSGDGND